MRTLAALRWTILAVVATRLAAWTLNEVFPLAVGDIGGPGQEARDRLLHVAFLAGDLWCFMAPFAVMLHGLAKQTKAPALRRSLQRTGTMILLPLAAWLVISGIELACDLPSDGVRRQAYGRVAARAEPVIDAIEAFRADHGHPSDTLERLVPDYLPEVPTTGLALYPEFEYAARATEDHNPALLSWGLGNAGDVWYDWAGPYWGVEPHDQPILVLHVLDGTVVGTGVARLPGKVESTPFDEEAWSNRPRRMHMVEALVDSDILRGRSPLGPAGLARLPRQLGLGLLLHLRAGRWMSRQLPRREPRTHRRLDPPVPGSELNQVDDQTSFAPSPASPRGSAGPPR